MEKNNKFIEEVIELDRKIRYIEDLLNEFSKEQIVSYLATKMALDDYDFKDFPIDFTEK